MVLVEVPLVVAAVICVPFYPNPMNTWEYMYVHAYMLHRKVL